MNRTPLLLLAAILAAALFCLAPALALAQDAPKRIVLTGSAPPVAGERRIALVIGNARYSGEGVRPLHNPEHDAQAVSKTLQELGFTVTQLLDADRATLRDSVHVFTHDVAQDGAHTVALLYYSGHGMQVNGKNYLIPISLTTLPGIEDIDDYAYPVDKALGEMQGAGARVNIVILDACRDNPYDTHKSLAGKGLAKMEAQGVYIAYATAEGQTADDNPAAANGLYTQELLKALTTPGKDIHQMFQMARRGVVAASQGAQYPYDYDGLLFDDFYFAGLPPIAAPTINPVVTPAPNPAPLPITPPAPLPITPPAPLPITPPAPLPITPPAPPVVTPPVVAPIASPKPYKAAHFFAGHTGCVNWVCFSPDSKHVASASWDGTVKLWDASNGQCLQTIPEHTVAASICYSPDGKRIASGCFDKSIKVLDADTGQCLQTLTGHADVVNAVCYSPDGKRIASASTDHTIKVWEVDIGQCLETLIGHTDNVNAVCFSPDGKRIASGSLDHTVRLWDVDTGQCLQTLIGHTDHVNSVCFSPDGKRIASGSNDLTVKIWEAESGQCIQTLTGHTSIVLSVCYSPDSRRIASASDDDTVKLWNNQSGDCLQTLPLADYGTSVAFSPDGRRLVTGSKDGQVRIYDAEAP